MFLRASLLLSLLCLSLCVGSTVGVSNTKHESAVRTPPAAPRTLALLLSQAQQQSHSTFFNLLRSTGHQLTFIVAGEDPVRLEKYGTPLYDNLIVMAPSAEELGEGASASAVQSFIDAGRSVLLFGDVDVAEPTRELAAELGIDIDEDGTRVQDSAAQGQKGAVQGVLSKRAANFVPTSSKSKAPVMFSGIGHFAHASQLLTPVLTGSSSAFSAAAGARASSDPDTTGSSVLLVSALQTRGNARAVFCGSVSMFSNDMLSASGNGNEAFVRDISAWVFHERGLLRARQLTHYKIGAEHDVNPGSYRVQDNIHFHIVLEEYSGAKSAWVPFVSDDVQLEFIMLDPYIRLNLASSSNGTYSADFQVPDVYGVYKFVVEYRRAGMSRLDVASQVSVHPFRHDEFDRFIGQAYPYYTAAFTMMAAFFTFGIVFLYHKEE